jgi:hypothetical protein
VPVGDDRRPVSFRAEMPSDHGRHDPRRLVIVTGVFLVVALVKPWPAVVRPPVIEPTPRPAVADELSPPAPATPPPSAVSLLCLEPRAWRVASVEMTLGLRVRSWGLILPISTTDPRDPAIPRENVVSPSLIALGYCAPIDRPPPDDVGLTIFRLDPTGPPRTVDVIRLGPNPASPLGGLYLPAPRADPSGRIPATDTWPSGTYVFHLQAAGGYEQWFGANVRILGS